MHLLSSAAIWSVDGNPVPPELVWIILGALILVGLISVLVPLMARQNAPADSSLWRAGIFYVNPSDPALFVPKRFGIGYTINFGNRWSWLLIAILVVLILGPVVFSAVTISSIRHHLNSH